VVISGTFASTMKLSVCLVVLSLQICGGWQTPKTYGDWVSEGITMATAGNYGLASRAFRQALSAASESGVSGQLLVRIMNSLASTYADAGQYLDAEREWHQALAMVEKTEGPESLDYALLVASIGTLPTPTENGPETINTVRRAIARYKDGGTYRDLALLRGCLVQMLIRQKQYAEAERVLADWQSAPKDDSHRQQLAQLLNTVGGTQFEQGRFAESVESFRQVLTVIEGEVGIEHPMLVVPLNNLATSLLKMGNTGEADRTYQRAIGICMKTVGGDHPTCGALLENYSALLRKQGRKREAKQMARQARQIQQASDRRNGLGAVISFERLRAAGR